MSSYVSSGPTKSRATSSVGRYRRPTVSPTWADGVISARALRARAPGVRRDSPPTSESVSEVSTNGGAIEDQSLGDVKVIEELLRDDDPNVYLKAGWKLIAAYPSSAYPGEPSVQCMHYVVGWAGDGEPALPEAV